MRARVNNFDCLCSDTVEFENCVVTCNVIRTELSEHSGYFKTLFKHHLNGRKVILPEFLSPGFQSVLDYIRNGETDISSMNVYDIVIAADYLLIARLKQDCAHFINNQLENDPSTALRLWIKFRQLFWPELGHRALLKVLANFQEASQSADFLSLSLEDLVTLLENDQLNIAEEYSLLDVIARWVAHNPKANVTELLLNLRLDSLSPEELHKLRNNPLVRTQPVYSQFLEMWPVAMPTQQISQLQINRMHSSRNPQEVLIVFGGWCSEEGPGAAVQVFNAKSNVWNVCPSSLSISQMPKRVYASAVLMGSRVFLIGGFDGTRVVKSTLCYDFSRDSGWVYKSYMYEKRYFVSATECNGVIYALGGHNGEAQGRLSSAEKYIAKDNQWQLIACMNKVRSDASAVSVDGRVYVIGGFDGRTYDDSTECYDPATDHWTILTRMSTARGGLSCVVHEGLIYAIGGNDGFRRLKSIEKYNPETNSWEYFQNMNKAKSNFSSVVIDNTIYNIGGWSDESEVGIMDQVERIDIKSKKISSVDSLHFPASATCVCILRDIDLVDKYVNCQPTMDHNVNNNLPARYRDRSNGDTRRNIRAIIRNRHVDFVYDVPQGRRRRPRRSRRRSREIANTLE
ncbi:hypothetical protein Ciccas_006893 [Cichlidogyrus casuarinus]|uniref:BTB domain-containing protein n=1 Tax=Cichlidogyrus casuarinus TaxID=1844966 RepID=A0ABD2Q4F1_9PLAT